MSMSLTFAGGTLQGQITSHYKGIDSTSYDYGSYGPDGLSITGAGALDPPTALEDYGGASLKGTIIDGVIRISGSSEPPTPPSDDPQAYNIGIASLNAKFNDAVTASTQASVTFTSIFQGTASAGASVSYRLEVYPLGGSGALVDIHADAVSQTVTLMRGITYVVSLIDGFSVPGEAANTGTSLSTTASYLYAYTVTEVDLHGVPIAGNPDLTFDSGLTHISIACYAAGTRIATPGGDIAVEQLTPGTPVTTFYSGTAPVRWLGRRRIDCRRHPDPARVMPIRVRAHAFGPHLPRQDVLLSPDHKIHAEGVLIPIVTLVNGITILRENIAQVTYYHVELATHDVLLAEGLPAESYLDNGNRTGFENASPAPRTHPSLAGPAREARLCAPLVVSGPAHAAVVTRLARIAATSITGPASPRPPARRHQRLEILA